MKILLFSGTGMIGCGVLRWLLNSPDVDQVVAASRKPLPMQHLKLNVVIEADMFHLQHLGLLQGFDACFFCLDVNSVGMKEAEYRRITKDLTLAIALQLLPGNPRMIFEHISGERADLHGPQMWLRVKAEADEAVLAAGFHDAYAFATRFYPARARRRSPPARRALDLRHHQCVLSVSAKALRSCGHLYRFAGASNAAARPHRQRQEDPQDGRIECHSQGRLTQTKIANRMFNPVGYFRNFYSAVSWQSPSVSY